jgi:hypothetical protein
MNPEPFHDIADTPAASEETGVAHLEPAEELIEELRMGQYGVDPSQEAIIREWFDEGGGGGGDKREHSALSEVLYMFTENRDARVLAWAMLLLIGKCPYSGEHVASMCGHTRASFSKIKRELENRFGIRSRVQRSEESIEHSRELCIERGQKTKQNTNTWDKSKQLADGLGLT